MHISKSVKRLRPRSRRQYVIVASAIVVVLAATGFWVFGRSDSTAAQSTVAAAATGTFQQTVTGSGTIQPAEQADLNFGVSGRVMKVSVSAGDKVKKGQVLAELDTVSLDAALVSANAQLDAASTTAASDAAASGAQRASDAANLASARASLAQATVNLAAATLRSTIKGTVAAVTVAVGDQTGSSGQSLTAGSGQQSAAGNGGSSGNGDSASSASTASTAAVTVVSPKQFDVDVQVAATDIQQIKKGLQATITPTGATAAIFGTVKEVGLVATVGSSGAATFPVTVAVTGSQSGLYAGTSASVSIIVKQVQNVLTVPSLALTTSGGKTYVEQVTGSSTKRTLVKVGQTYGASTQITSGLSTGDKVTVTIPTGFGNGTRTPTRTGAGGFGGAGGGAGFGDGANFPGRSFGGGQ